MQAVAPQYLAAQAVLSNRIETRDRSARGVEDTHRPVDLRPTFGGQATPKPARTGVDAGMSDQSAIRWVTRRRRLPPGTPASPNSGRTLLAQHIPHPHNEVLSRLDQACDARLVLQVWFDCEESRIARPLQLPQLI